MVGYVVLQGVSGGGEELVWPGMGVEDGVKGG